MATINPVTKTIGQTVDADVAILKAKVAALEAKAEADAKSVEAWVKGNWPHFVTWAGGIYLAVKNFL